MAIIHFPDPNFASPEGIVAISSSLNTANLIQAYRQGIFPWPLDEYFVPWCCPAERAILEFNELRIPRRLLRLSRQAPFHFTIDKAFEAVIVSCANVARKTETGTWITREMVRAYCELHSKGYAHSVEAWDGNTLVGGVYGVDAGGAFSGESMFYYRPNASKLALLYLIEYLLSRGLDWIDIQMITPHMEALGAKTVPRSTFLKKLSLALSQNRSLF